MQVEDRIEFQVSSVLSFRCSGASDAILAFQE